MRHIPHNLITIAMTAYRAGVPRLISVGAQCGVTVTSGSIDESMAGCLARREPELTTATRVPMTSKHNME